MSDVIVADVRVRERAGRRVTTIRVIEGTGGDVWPARATSVPPIVRDKIAVWIKDVPGPEPDGQFEDGGLHVGAGAVVQTAEDPPKTVTARTPGFVPATPAGGTS